MHLSLSLLLEWSANGGGIRKGMWRDEKSTPRSRRERQNNGSGGTGQVLHTNVSKDLYTNIMQTCSIYLYLLVGIVRPLQDSKTIYFLSSRTISPFIFPRAQSLPRQLLKHYRGGGKKSLSPAKPGGLHNDGD